MKITPFTLRLTLLFIFLKLVLKVLQFQQIQELLDLSFDIHEIVYVLFSIENIYILIFFFIFLNKFLLFRKANSPLIAIIITSFLSFIYWFYNMNNSEDLEKKEFIITIITGSILFLSTLTICIMLLKYKGILRRNILIYIASEFIVIILSLSFPLLLLLLNIDIEKNPEIVLLPQVLSHLFNMLPSLALFLLFYKAIQNVTEVKFNSDKIIDGGEFNVISNN